MPRLEEWALIPAGDADPYTAPELVGFCLVGWVTGHKREELNGKHIRTSRIVRAEGDCIVTRSGTLYEIGKPNERYEAEYPNARERLFAAVAKVASE
jgi:hypothetical protein